LTLSDVSLLREEARGVLKIKLSIRVRLVILLKKKNIHYEDCKDCKDNLLLNVRKKIAPCNRVRLDRRNLCPSEVKPSVGLFVRHGVE